MNKSVLNKELIKELFGNNNIKEITVKTSQIKEELSNNVLNKELITELFGKEVEKEMPVKEKSPSDFFSYRQEVKEDESEEMKPIERLKKFVKGFMPGFANTTIMKFDKMNGDIKKIREYFEEQRAGQEQNKDHAQYGLFYRYYNGIIKEIEKITS